LLPRGTLPKAAVAKPFRNGFVAAPPAAPEQFRLAIRSLIEQRYGDHTTGLRSGDNFFGN
jgi:hypothetical protein